MYIFLNKQMLNNEGVQYIAVVIVLNIAIFLYVFIFEIQDITTLWYSCFDFANMSLFIINEIFYCIFSIY